MSPSSLFSPERANLFLLLPVFSSAAVFTERIVELNVDESDSLLKYARSVPSILEARR
jgi:hypothetical protein